MMHSFLSIALTLAGTPLTGDDTPLQALAIILALALCVLTGITCWRVFVVARRKQAKPEQQEQKEQSNDETSQQTPQDK